MIAALIPASASGSVSKWVCMDFENSDITEVKAVSAVISRTTETTHGNSLGALDISVTKDSGAPSVAMTAQSGESYDISCYIMMKETPLIDKVQFIFQAPTQSNATKKGYNAIAVSSAGLKANQWVHIKGTYTCDGYGKQVGVTQRVPITENGTVDIRIGDGNIAATAANGSTIDYYLDDLIVLPRVSSSPAELAKGGTFESDTDLSFWTKSTSTTAVIAAGGANGTDDCVNVSSVWNTSSLSQKLTVNFNTKYRITFWLKAATDDCVNTTVQLIFDRKNSKTDTNIKNYEYLTDAANRTLNSEWTKYTIDYEYDITTSDTSAYPTAYIRLGSGTPTTVNYYLDEFSLIPMSEITNAPSLSLNVTGNLKSGNTITADMVYTGTETPASYIYTVMRNTPAGYTIIAAAETTAATFTYTLNDYDEKTNLKITARSVSAAGKVTASADYISDIVSPERKIAASFDTEAWTDALSALSATVNIRNSNEEFKALCAIAVYDAAGNLLNVNVAHATIPASDTAETTVSTSSDANSALAKLFVWEDGSYMPFAREEINKIAGTQIIYVDSETGNDSNAATYAAPLKTVTAAYNKAKTKLSENTADVYVLLAGGTYNTDSTITIGPSGSTAGNKLIFSSFGKSKAVISGGRKIEGWSLYDSAKNIYRAYVGTGINTRQFYVNDIRADRAASAVPLTNAAMTAAGYTSSDTALAGYAHPEDLEMVYYSAWTNPRCAVSAVTAAGSTATITLNATGFTKLQNKGMSSISSSILPAWYENTYELIDTEGEWYMNTHDGYMYYKPRFFEDMSSCDAEIPYAEKLLNISGTADNNVKNTEFDNIIFKYSTWLKPTTDGYLADVQDNYQSGKTGTDMIPSAAIEVSYADGITFSGCEIAKTGGGGIKLINGIKNLSFCGNELYDIAGNAITLGIPNGSYSQYVNPTDDRYIVRDNKITDNYIHRTGVDYRSSGAISAAFPKNTEISHNEICDCPYSGMHVGYGWNSYADTGTATEKLNIEANYIHNVMNSRVYDGAAIYLIGNTGGSTADYNTVKGNYIKDVKNLYGALYPDEGSRYWEMTQNVIDLSNYPLLYGASTANVNGRATEWLHLWTSSIMYNHITDNYATTNYCENNGTDNSVDMPAVYAPDEWPSDALALIEAAGIRSTNAGKVKPGLQEISALTEYSAEVGDEVALSLTGKTAKDKRYDLTDAEIHIKNEDPDIISIGSDLKGTALAAGEATVEVAVAEKGIAKIFTMNISIQ